MHLGSRRDQRAPADATPAAAADPAAEAPQEGKSPARKRKAAAEGADAAAAAPRSSQRLLFEGLRSALAEGSGASAAVGVAEAALAALPWLLSGYCTAIKSYRATLAAGKSAPQPCATGIELCHLIGYA